MNEYPNYVTQGRALDELRDMFRDIFETVRDGALSGMRHHSGVFEFA